jgi:hypothetical protein
MEWKRKGFLKEQFLGEGVIDLLGSASGTIGAT